MWFQWNMFKMEKIHPEIREIILIIHTAFRIRSSSCICQIRIRFFPIYNSDIYLPIKCLKNHSLHLGRNFSELHIIS